MQPMVLAAVRYAATCLEAGRHVDYLWCACLLVSTFSQQAAPCNASAPRIAELDAGNSWLSFSWKCRGCSGRNELPGFNRAYHPVANSHLPTPGFPLQPVGQSRFLFRSACANNVARFWSLANDFRCRQRIFSLPWPVALYLSSSALPSRRLRTAGVAPLPSLTRRRFIADKITHLIEPNKSHTSDTRHLLKP